MYKICFIEFLWGNFTLLLCCDKSSNKGNIFQTFSQQVSKKAGKPSIIKAVKLPKILFAFT